MAREKQNNSLFQKAAENGCRMVGVEKGSRVVLICDDGNKEIAEAFRAAAEKLAGNGNMLVINLDEGKFGPRPIIELPESLKKALADFRPTASLFIAANREGEVTFRKPLIDFLTMGLHAAHGHSPGMMPDIMRSGMLTDHGMIVKVTEAVYGAIKKAKEFRITAPAGTDLRVWPSDRMSWVLEHSIMPGKWGNLPIGEIFTCPERVEGRMVVDGVLGDYFGQKFGSLEDVPVMILIRDSRAESISCPRIGVAHELQAYIAKDINGDRVGEVGFGTNVGIKDYIGNMLQDEKRSFHLAFGNPYPEKTGAKWESFPRTHVDCCMRDCTIDIIMRNGKTMKLMEGGRYTDAVLSG